MFMQHYVYILICFCDFYFLMQDWIMKLAVHDASRITLAACGLECNIDILNY